MIIAAHNMLTNGDFYRDPGANYYTAHQPARTKSRAINQLESLGYRVTLEPLTESA
jgi:transposase